MPIPTSILDLDTSEALNSPAGSDSVGGTLDNYLRSHAAIIRRQFSKGTSINSAATLAVPPDGSYLTVAAVVSTIEAFEDNFDGRMVVLKFEAGITLAHSSALILPAGLDIVTQDGDTGCFVNEEPGVWRCLSYSRNGLNRWTGKFIGEVFALQTDITGVVYPPTDSPDFRYIVLTASADYNDGALTDETVDGSSPTITATAVIDYPASPLHGQTVRLINTERRFLRAGSAGTVQDSANLAHNHTAVSGGSHNHSASSGNAGSHTHSVSGTAASAGAHTHAVNFRDIANGRGSLIAGTTSGASESTPTASAGAHTHSVSGTAASAGTHNHSVSVSSAGAHTHTINDSGTTESRPYNMGITYLMRIA